jgi:hypothetical protein
MKTFKITALAAIFGVVVTGAGSCHAQSDPDCTPSAQRVARDLQTDGTFSGDPTMRDILAYAIDKCSVDSLQNFRDHSVNPYAHEVDTTPNPMTTVMASYTPPVAYLAYQPPAPKTKHRGKW